MSTHAAAPTGRISPVAAKDVSFPRVLHAEWIKLWSLRSTYWTVGTTVAAMVLIAVMLAATLRIDGQAAVEGLDGTAAVNMGYTFAQVVVAVLGVLTITGEYATGMIRSTLAAVPTRVPVLAAKAVLIAVVGFVLGVAGMTVAYLASYPLLGAAGAADLSDPEVRRMFWGTGLYLAAVGLLGLGVGAILRHTAGALTAVLGVLLMLPTLWQLLMVTSDVFARALPFLPSIAGERIAIPREVTTVMGEGPQLLAPWPGFAVLMTYVVLTLVLAAVLLRRRDG
jgi:ABC-2 type transport system permease protein